MRSQDDTLRLSNPTMRERIAAPRVYASRVEVFRHRSCCVKRRRTEKSAIEACARILKKDPESGVQPYACIFCGDWHVGRTMIHPEAAPSGEELRGFDYASPCPQCGNINRFIGNSRKAR